MGCSSEIGPLYAGEPVIVVHLEDGTGTGRTVCTGAPFTHSDGDRYPEVPRVPCPHCVRTTVKSALTLPWTRVALQIDPLPPARDQNS